MANEYRPILISDASSLLPKPIAPQRKSILPVKIPIPAPRTSLESKTERLAAGRYRQTKRNRQTKRSDSVRGFACNTKQKCLEEKHCPDSNKNKPIIQWEDLSHCFMVIFLVLVGILITIFVSGMFFLDLLFEEL